MWPNISTLKVDISNSGDSSEDIRQVEFGRSAGVENPDGPDGNDEELPSEGVDNTQDEEADSTESTEGN